MRRWPGPRTEVDPSSDRRVDRKRASRPYHRLRRITRNDRWSTSITRERSNTQPFNLFFLPYFMTQGEPFGRTEILVTQAYRLAYERRLFGVAAAFAVNLFFLLLVLTLITNRMAKATKSYAE